MKRFLLLVIAVFSASSVMADCAGEGLFVFPSGGEIRQNGVFLLEGYAESRNIVYGLNTKYPAYLKSGDKKIRLTVKETHMGQFWVAQALLVPETELEAGRDYTLCIDGLPEYEQLGNYEYTTGKYVPYSYRAIEGTDTEMPVVSAIPKETGKSYVAFGCGPAMYVHFDVPATDASPLLVKTTVKNRISGEETTYYLVTEDGKISIGHNMCAGAFVFAEDAGNDYEATFAFMDVSGNLRPLEGPPVVFTRPGPEDGE
jgi:hypothetical protein